MIGQPDYSIVPVGQERLRLAKQSFATRRADLRKARTLIVDRRPRSGDLLLAEVSAIGHHTKLESPEGNGAPGRIRTCGLMLRRHVLYPAELRARTGLPY